MTYILVCRAVAPDMMARKAGWIINISSIAGIVGRDEGAIYATTKAAVHEYTHCLAARLRPHNVNVSRSQMLTEDRQIRRGFGNPYKAGFVIY